MSNNETLYISSEDLYRLGNASSSLISRVREQEVDTIQVNGIKVVLANKKGISLYNKIGIDKTTLSGWVWEIRQGTFFPQGLQLIKDDSPEGHYTLAPTHNMPFTEYISLLEKIALHCQKVFRKKA